MAITLNDCFTTADLPAASDSEGDFLPRRARHRACVINSGEADQLMAAFLAAGNQIKTYPPAYAARSAQYHVMEPPKPHE
jgi:hypothetical protein